VESTSFSKKRSLGIVIATHEGSVIRSTLDNIQTPQIATLVTQLAAKGKGVVRDLDPEVS
jgi:dynein light chain roadblock-type